MSRLTNPGTFQSFTLVLSQHFSTAKVTTSQGTYECGMTIEELPHTADVMVRVRARDLCELFTESVQALMNTMYGQTDHGKGELLARTLKVEASDLDSLLQEYLSEVLYLSEVENLVFISNWVCIEGTNLTATLEGRPFDPLTDSGGTEVKGISYSGLHILKDGKGYVLEIIFDV